MANALSETIAVRGRRPTGRYWRVSELTFGITKEWRCPTPCTCLNRCGNAEAGRVSAALLAARNSRTRFTLKDSSGTALIISTSSSRSHKQCLSMPRINSIEPKNGRIYADAFGCANNKAALSSLVKKKFPSSVGLLPHTILPRWSWAMLCPSTITSAPPTK